MKNCWDAKNCGRTPGGHRAGELGVCPAATEARLDGIHSGKNGGRACWAIAGTLCGGAVQGTFAEKEENCMACDHYKAVRKSANEENCWMNFISLSGLLGS